MRASDLITIGALSARTGVPASAIRFYEARGLVRSQRSAGGQRRFLRADIRRVSFIRIAQRLGLSIDAIGGELAMLPDTRTPTAADWARISTRLQQALDARIAALTRTREALSGCIGCGCLSLKKCALYNPEDRAAALGPGPRYALAEDAGET